MKEKIKLFRSRFAGRQDVYGRKTTFANGKSIYIPVCENYGSKGCHITLGDGKGCSGCEFKKYTSVTDESVLRHISGQEEQNTFVLLEDGNIYFGALDFDCKPGKESQGYHWDDIKATSDQLKEWGIPHYIARSTTLGFHIYFFFKDPYPAYKFRSAMIALFSVVGFNEQALNAVRALPEMFPKQSYLGSGASLGNAIKCPMIEPQFAVERNGFVDENNNFIAADKQWEFLENTKLIEAADFDKFLEEKQIRLFDIKAPTKSSRGAIDSSAYSHMPTGVWQPPRTGSIEKVLEGCAAFRKIRDKCLAGAQPSHDEGMALFHVCMKTRDGIEWFKKNVPGWAKTERDWRQLEYSLAKGYKPNTCATMQTSGLCTVGTKCFDKKPIPQLFEGQLYSGYDTPPSEWPEPSPIRYAFGSGDDFLKKLVEEAKAINPKADSEEISHRIFQLAKRAQVFDNHQVDKLQEEIKKLKIAKTRHVQKLFRDANTSHRSDMKDTAAASPNSASAMGKVFDKLEPYGYGEVNLNQEGKKIISKVICDFDIDISESRSYIDDEGHVEAFLVGRVKSANVDKAFEIKAAKWVDNREFAAYFSNLLDVDYKIAQTSDVGAIRQAALAFAEKKLIKRSSFLTVQGWHKGSYLMPSVIIDKDNGVRPNLEQNLDLSQKTFVRNLDFQILDDNEFKDVLIHLKRDFLNAWPRDWSMTALAHALLPIVHSPFKIEKRPTLFFEGLTGGGKTDLIKTVQCLWGDFEKILNIQSTGKGLIKVAYDCKDALLAVDDYKGLDRSQINSLWSIVQYSYDGSDSVKLRRDSSLMPSVSSRTLFIMSGEDFAANQASMVARCIKITSPGSDQRKTAESYQKCLKMRRHYNGITPVFIHWFLNQNHNDYLHYWDDQQKVFIASTDKKTNISRMSYNLSMNLMVWKMFVDFLVFHGVCTLEEAESLVEEHKQNMLMLLDTLSHSSEDEQVGYVFMRLFKQAIAAQEVFIRGVPSDAKNKTCIGMLDGTGSFIYVYPDIAINVVKRMMGNDNWYATQQAISRHLYEMGLLVGKDRDHYTRKLQNLGKRARVWVFKKGDLIEVGDDKQNLNYDEEGIV